MRTQKILFGVGAAIIVTIVSVTNPATTTTVSAQGNPAAPGQVKKYKATRPLVADAQTGAVRMPTQEEVDQAVGSLSSLTKSVGDSPTQTSAGGGAVTIDLDGGSAGVMLARPNSDGTWETRCVFSLDEGAEFLGLVVDNQQ